MGRFITEDPIKDGNTWYIYAANNPLMYIDPTGLEIQKALQYGRNVIKGSVQAGGGFLLVTCAVSGEFASAGLATPLCILAGTAGSGLMLDGMYKAGVNILNMMQEFMDIPKEQGLYLPINWEASIAELTNSDITEGEILNDKISLVTSVGTAPISIATNPTFFGKIIDAVIAVVSTIDTSLSINDKLSNKSIGDSTDSMSSGEYYYAYYSGNL